MSSCLENMSIVFSICIWINDLIPAFVYIKKLIITKVQYFMFEFLIKFWLVLIRAIDIYARALLLKQTFHQIQSIMKFHFRNQGRLQFIKEKFECYYDLTKIFNL